LETAIITSVQLISIVSCSAAKSECPSASLLARHLPHGTTHDVAGLWLERIASSKQLVAADQLYQGRGFKIAQSATRQFLSDLYVISAGMGLI
jgi:hypothetical protein